MCTRVPRSFGIGIGLSAWLLQQPGGNRTKAILMMVAGAVVAFNAWVVSLPVPA
jgi:hypothetical protein